MNGCFYCERGKALDDLMIPVCELSLTRVYLMRNQNYPGRCVVAWKNHAREIFELSAEEQAGFATEVSLTAKAIHQLFAPDKLNYGIFGDLVPHLHCHIAPKKQGGLTWGVPFQAAGNEFFPPAELLEARAKEIGERIASLRG
jgi:diadenosine tetraphosphate (Ap4A) HIT family hydrolase